MKIEMVPIEVIREYERNPRVNEAAVGPVAESIKAFGFRVPVIVDADNVLVAGHTRVKAARHLEMTEVPAVRADDLTPEQIKAFRIADNKLHELSSWNLERLAIEIGDLQAMNVDLDLLGFNEDELAEILNPGVKDGLTDPDAIPDPPDEAITQPGDLWVMGDHRLLCGDNGSAADVDRLLDGQPIHLVNTDPPYNVKVEPRSNNAIAAGLSSFGEHGLLHHQSFDLHRMEKRSRSRYHGMDVATGAQSGKATHKKLRPKDRPLVNDFVSDEEFDQMLHAWFGNIARVLLPGRAFYIWGGYANIGNYPPVLKACELYFAQAIIWDKQHPVLTRKDFMGAHEWCFYGWRQGAAHVFLGPNNATDVWSVKKVNPQSMIHLTEKPTELAVRAMQYSSRAGENVLDLFGGSGSTAIAAEQIGRRAFLMEIDALYCDVIVARYEKFTGKKAKRRACRGKKRSNRSNAPDIAEALVQGK
jgi:DNA modification methylase